MSEHARAADYHVHRGGALTGLQTRETHPVRSKEHTQGALKLNRSQRTWESGGLMRRYPRSNAKLTRWTRQRTLEEDAALFLLVVGAGGVAGLIAGVLF